MERKWESFLGARFGVKTDIEMRQEEEETGTEGTQSFVFPG